MPIAGCFCDDIPRISTATEVLVVSQWLDFVRPSNTARLALAVLERSQLLLRGLPHQPLLKKLPIAEDTRLLMLYAPAPENPEPPELNPRFGEAQSGRHTVLLVPDGTWSQSRRMVRREQLFHGAEMVKLPPGPPSRYELRDNRDPHELCTYEAISRALGLLEDDPEVSEAMDPIFERMVSTLLRSRGKRRQRA